MYPPIRGKVWILLAERSLHIKRKSGLYNSLLAKKPSKSAVLLIEKDVTRTIPTSEFAEYNNTKYLTTLRNVLYAYSIYDKDVEYCQGMNYIAFMLVIHMQEEDAFWLFVALMQGMGLRDIFHGDTTMLKDLMRIVRDELKRQVPEVADWMEAEGVSIASFCTEWITTLFVYNLPLYVVRRIWDCLFMEGRSGIVFLFKVAIAIYILLKDFFLKSTLEQLMLEMRMMVFDLSPLTLLEKAVDVELTHEATRDLYKYFGRPKTEMCSIS